jgi:hypothetical protein
MNYIEMYITKVDEKDDLQSQDHKLYLLPGLADVHTSAISGEDLIKCKREYNRYLEMFKHLRDTTTRGARSKDDENNMLVWLGEMHDLLYKIGQYSHEETLNGFIL